MKGDRCFLEATAEPSDRIVVRVIDRSDVEREVVLHVGDALLCRIKRVTHPVVIEAPAYAIVRK
jgi:hypothetical protein